MLIRVSLRTTFHRSEPWSHLVPVVAERLQLAPLIRGQRPEPLSLDCVQQCSVVVRMPSLTPSVRIEPLTLCAQVALAHHQLGVLGLDRLQQCFVVVWMPPLTFGVGLEPLVPRRQIEPERAELGTLGLCQFQLSERVLVSLLTRRMVFEPLAQCRQIALEVGHLLAFVFVPLQPAILIWMILLPPLVFIEPCTLGGPVVAHLGQRFLALLERLFRIPQRLVVHRMPSLTPGLGVEPHTLHA